MKNSYYARCEDCPEGLVETNMLKSIEMNIQFDRTPDKNKHYIIPGGYELKYDNKLYSFDFMDSERYIGKNNSVYFKALNLDTDSFPEATEITPELVKKAVFSEFYIYTGEDNEPEIWPINICEVALNFDNGERVEISQVQLVEINNALKRANENRVQ